MDFTFTDEQQMTAQALGELLDDTCTGADLRALADGTGAAAAAGRWQRLIEMGLAGALAPEAAGGLGLTEVDFVLLAEAAGRAALPEPLVAHAGVAVPLLAELVAAGAGAPVGAVLARAASGADCVLVAAPDEAYVANPGAAAWFVAGPTGDQVVLLPGASARLAPQAALDPLQPLARVGVPAGAAPLALAPAAARGLWRRAELRAQLFAAAELLGLAARLVAITVAYASERRQFGRPIGSNQAVKHHLATVQVQLEFARPVVHAAAAHLADFVAAAAAPAAPPPLIEARLAQAKLAAAAAADLAARTAIQVHGAIGYSWELDLQFYAKRAWALAARHGDRNRLQRRVQELLFSGAIVTGTDRLFPD